MNNSAEGEEGEEDQEFYYESFDRILSSSCSSTSPSDDEGDYGYQLHDHRRFGSPPPSAASLDVWLHEPAPVEERRFRLLQQMGLAGDPALSRQKHESWAREGEMGRSASCGGLWPRSNPPLVSSSAGAMGRSRSDGVHELVRRPPRSAVGKPPLVGRSRLSVGGDMEVSNGDVPSCFGDLSRCGDGEDDQSCTIKDLDNGKEFVVKEFREDGMWNKLREVGTGRHITMEEFETSLGCSPIVQELMRRQNVEEGYNDCGWEETKASTESNGDGGSKRRSSWFWNFKSVMAGGNQREPRSSDEKDTSSEKGGRRSSSATDDSQNTPKSLHRGPERTKVRQNGKTHKELTGLFLNQEIQAHNGSIWTIKFSLDGRYLASAGEDRVIHVWQVLENDRKPEFLVDRGGEEINNGNLLAVTTSNDLPGQLLAVASMEGNHWKKKRKAKGPGGRTSVSSDHLMLTEQVFALSDRPVCSFRGHLYDVLDLSWSKAQYLLSSSMDKTVRLWHLSNNCCLKIFSHNDYVTCIQFNPMDDRYFISGSLDAKVRVWSIPGRQVVDWSDLHEMVTAVCYTPDGQGALVGSHKGNCHLYDASDNKLIQKGKIDLQNRKKKSSHKKITGFQFVPGSSSEVLITSADSRIRVVDGGNLIHKFKGFRNTSSQISACLTANSKYVICASEDSHVYIWRYDTNSRSNRSKSIVTVTQSYEYFHCLNVTAAVPWPNFSFRSGGSSIPDDSKNSLNSVPKQNNNNTELFLKANHFGDTVSASWPEEKLLSTSGRHSRQNSSDLGNQGSSVQGRALGMVIVAASRGGEIRAYQNFGFPIRA